MAAFDVEADEPHIVSADTGQSLETKTGEEKGATIPEIIAAAKHMQFLHMQTHEAIQELMDSWKMRRGKEIPKDPTEAAILLHTLETSDTAWSREPYKNSEYD